MTLNPNSRSLLHVLLICAKSHTYSCNLHGIRAEPLSLLRFFYTSIVFPSLILDLRSSGVVDDRILLLPFSCSLGRQTLIILQWTRSLQDRRYYLPLILFFDLHILWLLTHRALHACFCVMILLPLLYVFISCMHVISSNHFYSYFALVYLHVFGGFLPPLYAFVGSYDVNLFVTIFLSFAQYSAMSINCFTCFLSPLYALSVINFLSFTQYFAMLINCFTCSLSSGLHEHVSSIITSVTFHLYCYVSICEMLLQTR